MFTAAITSMLWLRRTACLACVLTCHDGLYQAERDNAEAARDAAISDRAVSLLEADPCHHDGCVPARGSNQALCHYHGTTSTPGLHDTTMPLHSVSGGVHRFLLYLALMLIPYTSAVSSTPVPCVAQCHCSLLQVAKAREQAQVAEAQKAEADRAMVEAVEAMRRAQDAREQLDEV